MGGTAAVLGLSTAALFNNNARTAPASQPVVINNYYNVSPDDTNTETSS
jgi:hypothetical protein